MLNLVESHDSQAVSLFAFKDFITDLYKLKDEALLEAVFAELDSNKQGYVDANDILVILKNHVD